ncbi:helix-hairpin-helix domain-containing protein [Streptomyces klenkii]|nr:helix-hairpin-helix domain-containing protein [Streptomyces sp. NRRL B-1677]
MSLPSPVVGITRIAQLEHQDPVELYERTPDASGMQLDPREPAAS